jgi:hypothetical protein
VICHTPSLRLHTEVNPELPADILVRIGHQVIDAERHAADV